jgi:hypothetical protein
LPIDRTALRFQLKEGCSDLFGMHDVPLTVLVGVNALECPPVPRQEGCDAVRTSPRGVGRLRSFPNTWRLFRSQRHSSLPQIQACRCAEKARKLGLWNAENSGQTSSNQCFNPSRTPMPTITARQSLTAIWLILFSAKQRAITEEEKDELARLCAVLQQGIPDRAIYTYAAREFCRLVQTSGLFDTGTTPHLDDLMEKVDAMKLMVG